MYWLVIIGALVVVIYWLGSSSRGRGYHDTKMQEEYLRELERKRTEAEIEHRTAELRRQRFGWRKR